MYFDPMAYRPNRKSWIRYLALFAVFAQVIGNGSFTRACDWDSETLIQERMRFPTALEIIVGKFPRHSSAYYEWRLKDRLEKLKANSDDHQLLDDLAVSHEKLGQYEKAIAVAQRQLTLSPDRYESLANLGTFLIHSGKLQQGLKYIEKAIEVNPDAHFGREKYQVHLVRYVISKSADGEVQLPLASRDEEKPRFGEDDFCSFLALEIREDGKKLSTSQTNEAITGILGMMRFSRHDSPILLEVLGDLQLSLGANQLAYRAYKSAALHAKEKPAKAAYEKWAAVSMQWKQFTWKVTENEDVPESALNSDFTRERNDADAWFAKIVRSEAQWIKEGVAVDENFNDEFRGLQPIALETDPLSHVVTYRPQDYSGDNRRPAIGIVIVTACSIIGVLIYVLSRRRQQKKVVAED